VNGGLRFHYFFKQNEITVSLQQDISQVHKGQVASFAFKRIWQINDNRIKLTAGAHWKSSNLLDYYYGIDQKDTQHSEFYYQGKSGFEPFFSLTLQKPINRHWIWLGSIGSKRLAKGMSDSPIVVEKFIHRVFLGVAYRF
jgi:outer membrane protein